MTRRQGVGRLFTMLMPITLKGASLPSTTGRRAAKVRQSSQLSDSHADLLMDALSCVSFIQEEQTDRGSIMSEAKHTFHIYIRHASQ